MAYSWMKREWQLRRSFQSQWPGCPPSFLQVNTRGTPSLPTPAPPIPPSSLAPLHFSVASPFPPCCPWRLDLCCEYPYGISASPTQIVKLPPLSEISRPPSRLFSFPSPLSFLSLPPLFVLPMQVTASASWFCYEYATRRKVSRQLDCLFSFPSSLSFDDSPFCFLFSLFLHLWYIRLHPLD